MPKISNLTLVTPTLLDRTPILDDADNLTKVQNNQGIRDLLVQNIVTPQGHLINGRILPSVTLSAITLALKTYAGTDPSATDFVIANIGGTLRKISSALSVTLALGTNWMNLGSAELATIETDLFAYLGYNATDRVTIGYSRIPGAKVYSDFSVTTTNEKYLAVSNRTTASANDPYEVIGRFSAILSLTPFNWSVPTYTPTNLIQRPIYETRLLPWIPQYTGFTTITLSSNPHYYKFMGSMCEIVGHENVASVSNTTGFTKTFPFLAKDLLSSTEYTVVTPITDNSANSATPGLCTLPGGSNIMTCSTTIVGGVWTASGNKRVKNISLFYEI